jgi:hypothetical protein
MSIKGFISLVRDDHLHGFEEILANEIGLIFPRVALIFPFPKPVAA